MRRYRWLLITAISASALIVALTYPAAVSNTRLLNVVVTSFDV